MVSNDHDDRRKFYRVFAKLNFKFGPESSYASRELNLSASGAAFQVEDTNYFKTLAVKGEIAFSIQLDDTSLELTGEIIRLDSSGDKNLMAIRFVGLSPSTQFKIDEFVCSKGGYHADDPMARHEYLQKNFPHLAN